MSRTLAYFNSRLWLCGFGNIFLYVPLFFFSRGNLVFREGNNGKTHWDWHSTTEALDVPACDGNESVLGSIRESTLEQQELRSQAWNMLL
jgi:hypothetical protein